MVNPTERVLVFGNGQMASFVPRYFENTRISRTDITDPVGVEAEIREFEPSIVINTAAKTSIDWCQANPRDAFSVNTLGAKNVWDASRKNNVFCVHVSSGCIYHSETDSQIYTEDDNPNPRSYYSHTKVWAEDLLGKSHNLLILRPRMVISSEVSHRNTLAKWATYDHFIRDMNTMTVLEDMMPVVADMAHRKICGTFNIANPGLMSPLEAAEMLKEIVNPRMQIIPTTLDEVNHNLTASRCTTVLSVGKLKTAGYELPDARQSVRNTITEFARKLEEMGGLKALDTVRGQTRAKYTVVSAKPTTYDGTN